MKRFILTLVLGAYSLSAQSPKRLIASIILTVFMGSAQGAIVLLQVTGEVFDVDSELISVYSIGDSVSLRFTYDSNVTGIIGETAAEYLEAGLSLALTIGNEQISANYELNGRGVSIRDDAPADEFILAHIDLLAPEIVGLDPAQLYFNLVDFTAALWDAPDLPTSLPAWSYWDQVPHFFISYEDRIGNASKRASFSISSLSTIIVPIPAAVWLFGSALGLLGWMRRRVS